MTRKTPLVLTVACLALGVLVGFAGSAGAAHVPADDGGATNQDCLKSKPDCIGGGDPWYPPTPPTPPSQPPAEIGGGGGPSGGIGGGGCGGGPDSACEDL